MGNDEGRYLLPDIGGDGILTRPLAQARYSALNWLPTYALATEAGILMASVFMPIDTSRLALDRRHGANSSRAPAVMVLIE